MGSCKNSSVERCGSKEAQPVIKKIHTLFHSNCLCKNQQPMPSLSLTRMAFPGLKCPSLSQHDLILQALNGWGDPEQLTDREAVELKELCAKWFGIPNPYSLKARIWKDAVVFATLEDPSSEYAIILMPNVAEEEDPLLLYRFNRGHRLIPSKHSTTGYLEHVVDMAIDEFGI
jgi:hypothetical protein